MKVKTRTIVMLTVILVIAVGSFMLDEWYRFKQNTKLLAQEHTSITTKFYKSINKRASSMLKAEAGLIMRDSNIINLYKSGDKEALILSVKPFILHMQTIFPGSKQTLVFYRPDGTIYCNAINPGTVGLNPINFRPMLASVVKTAKPADGFELCSTTLSRRYITPLKENGRMIGILEVATDVGFIASRISSMTNIKTVVIIDQKQIDAIKCETVKRYNSDYINNSSVPFSIIKKSIADRHKEISYNGSDYELIKSFPLLTFNNTKLGTISFITKAGGLQTWFREHIIRAAIICVIGVLLIIYVAGRGFIESISELEKEHDKALSDLKEINLKLEDRIKAEVENCRRKDQIINQQQRVADMGMMLSALAHHWRQPINAVGLYVQDLSEAYRSGELTQDYIDEFEHNNMGLLTKLSDSIDKYRTFFEPSAEKTQFSIISVMREISVILDSVLPAEGIKMNVKCRCKGQSIECGLDSKIPECIDEGTVIEGFYNEFKQTLLNIIHNSIDSIKTRYVQEKGKVRDGIINVDIAVDGDRVAIMVSDNGTGIPDAIFDKIFNPFFTTKEEGKGTGIGLYMAKTVIEKYMGGTIEARNLARGVAVDIELSKAAQNIKNS